MEEEKEGTALPELPGEIFNVIERIVTKRLTTQTDALRFRAICKSWRALLKPPTPTRAAPFPIKLPHPITPDHLTSFEPPRRGYFNLSESTLYLVFPNSSCPPTVCPNVSAEKQPQPQPQPYWLARFQSTHSGKLRILDPFTGLAPENLPSEFPKLIDSLEFGVIELSKAYTANFVNTSRRRKDTDRTLVVDKAATISDRVMVLYNQGDLGYIKLGSMRWKVTYDYSADVHNDQTCYDDLIVFRGHFCVVNRTGRTLFIDRFAKSAVEIAQPISGFDGNPKHLLQMSGELYMIDRDFSAYTTHFSKQDTTGRMIASHLPTTMALKFRIYKLHQQDKRWLQINDLGDSALFVGYDCSFGFSTRFLPGCKGNCLYFVDQCYTYNSCFNQGKLAHVVRELGCPEAGIFDLKDGTVKPLMFSPDHLGLFWPPPTWLHPASS